MMQISPFIIMPLSGAIIGAFTNWLAIKMLFRPHTQKTVFGIKVPFTPGIIPKERHILAKKVGETVSKHLLTKEALANAVTSPETMAHIEKMVDELFERLANAGKENTADGIWENMRQSIDGQLPKLAETLENALENNPDITLQLKALTDKIIDENVGKFASLFINKDKIFDSIKTGFLTYLKDENNQAELWQKANEWLNPAYTKKAKDFLLGSISFALQKGAVYIAESIQIDRLVEDQINAFELMEGERIILSVVKKELNAITILGGVLGFVIGILTVFVG